MNHRCVVPVLLGTLLALPAGPALATDEVSFKPVLREGQEFSYVFGTTLDVVQKIGAAETEHTTSLKCSATADFKVVSVESDGSARLEATFRKASVKAPLGEQEMGFDWPSPVPLPEGAPALQRLGESLRGATISVSIDATGQAVVTGGFEKFAEAASLVDFPDERYKGFFTPDSFASLLTPLFRVDGAGAVPRAVGRGWQTSETVPLPPAGAIEVTTDFQVQESDPDSATYFGDITLSLKRPADPAADVATVSLKDGSGGGTKGVFNKRQRLLGYRKQSLTIYTQWTLGDARVEQSQFSGSIVRLADE